jgi:hypothetical protein
MSTETEEEEQEKNGASTGALATMLIDETIPPKEPPVGVAV